jgi:hypothetical protein
MIAPLETEELLTCRDAVARHALIRKRAYSPVALGRFYQQLLERRIWPTQAALADGLGISTSQVSRALAAARLPNEVIQAFGDVERITFRVVTALTMLIASMGVDVVRGNAARLPRAPELSVDAVLTAISTGESPRVAALPFKLSAGPGGRYIRIDSPHIARLLPRIPELEAFLSIAITGALKSVPSVVTPEA